MHARTSHEGPEWEKRHGSTVSSSSVLDVDGWLKSGLGHYTLWNNAVPIL